MTANPLKYQPAVNQVELNFWNPQPELLKVNVFMFGTVSCCLNSYYLLQWSKENGLLLEAYSPLGSNKQVGETLSVPEVSDAFAYPLIYGRP